MGYLRGGGKPWEGLHSARSIKQADKQQKSFHSQNQFNGGEGGRKGEKVQYHEAKLERLPNKLLCLADEAKLWAGPLPQSADCQITANLSWLLLAFEEAERFAISWHPADRGRKLWKQLPFPQGNIWALKMMVASTRYGEPIQVLWGTIMAGCWKRMTHGALQPL